MSMPPGPPAAPRGVRGADLVLILIVSLGAARLFGGLASSFLGPTLDAEGAAERALGLTIGLLVVQSAVMFWVIRAVAVRARGLSWADLGLRPVGLGWFGRAAATAVFLLPAVGLINLLVGKVTGAPLENPQIYSIAPAGFSWTGLVAMVLLAGIVAPVVEEMAFRGLLFAWLRARLGVPGAVVVSALCFAVLHGVPQLIPALTAIGIALALLYQLSGSLWPAVAAHGLFNTIMVATLYAALAGAIEAP